MSLSHDEQLKKQRQGARVTAIIVGAIAFGIFLLTLFLSGK